MLRAGRPVAVLAAAIAAYDRALPKRRGGARELLIAYMVLLSDWRSGRRSRPGRATAAAVLGTTQERIRQLWREAERLGIIVRTATGTRLPHETVRELSYETYRIADRSEWTVRPAPELRAEDVTADHVRRALAALAALARRFEAVDADLQDVAAPLARMRRVWEPVADALADKQTHPSFGPILGFITTVLPSRKCKSPLPASRKTKKNVAATRRLKTSSDKSQARPGAKPRRGRPMPAPLVALARTLRADDRLPQLRGCPVPVLAATVRSRAEAGWSAADIVTAVQDTARKRGESWGYYDPPIRPARPAAWLRTMLDASGYPVQQPPHVWTLVDAAVQAERIAAARARREADLARPSGHGGAGHQAARDQVAAASRRRSVRYGRHEAAAEQLTAQRQVEHERRQNSALSWEPVERDGLVCQAGCSAPGPDVTVRWLPGRGSLACCDGCHAWHTRPAARYEQ